jgi:hypothetical protein
MELPIIYGLMAEFNTPGEVLNAARRTRQAGYKTDAIGIRPSRIPLMVLLGGIIGGAGGFFMQYYAAVIGYPINIGGRPLNSWPSFIPITFELTVLVAGLTAVISMLFRNGLPRPYHPVFNVKNFERVTRDKFFLCIEATDAAFERNATEKFLKSLHPADVYVVEH